MAKILVLDDVDDAARLVKRVLEAAGHKVYAFSEEEKALAFVEQHECDLAILDIKLKKMDGLDVLAAIRQTAPHIQIIMLTGYPTIESAQESLRIGAVQYCVKPIDNEALEEIVNTVLTRPSHSLQP